MMIREKEIRIRRIAGSVKWRVDMVAHVMSTRNSLFSWRGVCVSERATTDEEEGSLLSAEGVLRPTRQVAFSSKTYRRMAIDEDSLALLVGIA